MLLISDANILIDMEERIITLQQAGAAYAAMRRGGRRLPWGEIEQQIRRLGADR